MRSPRALKRSACDWLYHFTKLLLRAYARPDRASSGAMSHAVIMAPMKASASSSASGNWPVGMISAGSMCAAIEATLTITAPSPATA